MPCIPLRQSFTEEYMTQMCSAVPAPYLCPLTVRIRETLHCPGDLLIKCRPAAVRVELVIGAVEFSIAAAAGVGPGFKEIVILSGEWTLRPLGLNDIPLLTREFVVLLFVHLLHLTCSMLHNLSDTTGTPRWYPRRSAWPPAGKMREEQRLGAALWTQPSSLMMSQRGRTPLSVVEPTGAPSAAAAASYGRARTSTSRNTRRGRAQ